MRGLIAFALASASVLAAAPALADGAMIEAFTMRPEAGLRFVTDAVKGGLSSGGVVFAQDDGQPHARMTGRMSNAHRSGFIQMRPDLIRPPPDGATGVRLVARGIHQR